MHVRKLRYLAPLATLAVLEASVPAAYAAAPAPSPFPRIVRPGQSVQAAVDAARPGDTVLVLPGVYRESVQITTSRLTLRGFGPATVFTPPAKSKPPRTQPGQDGRKAHGNGAGQDGRKAHANGAAHAQSPAHAAGTAHTRGKGRAHACAAAGHGICVTGRTGRPVTGVRIRTLTVSGFRGDGIAGSRTDRMSVRGVRVEKNGRQGISQERSTRGDVRYNMSRNNAQSGVFLANDIQHEGGALDTRGAVISDNMLTGNRIGVVLRRVRSLTVQRNEVTDNCGGVFVVSDESKPRAGALSIRNNNVHKNNRYCPPNPRLAFIQGTGILLTGAEDTQVTGNRVRDNAGTSPMSGGIVLHTSEVGAINTRNTISGNEVLGNRPADLADHDHGPGNTFRGNWCRRSDPDGRC